MSVFTDIKPLGGRRRIRNSSRNEYLTWEAFLVANTSGDPTRRRCKDADNKSAGFSGVWG
jgi:hypothetical protein